MIIPLPPIKDGAGRDNDMKKASPLRQTAVELRMCVGPCPFRIHFFRRQSDLPTHPSGGRPSSSYSLLLAFTSKHSFVLIGPTGFGPVFSIGVYLFNSWWSGELRLYFSAGKQDQAARAGYIG